MTAGVRIAAAVAASVAGIALVAGGSAVGSTATKIDQRVVRDTAGGKDASFLIHLADQADLSAADAIRDQDARGWYVYRTLTEHAARTQAPLRALLDRRNVPYDPYWVANVIVARGDRSLVEDLAARSDVAVIEANDPSKWIHDDAPSVSAASSAAVEPGVVQVHAPGFGRSATRARGS